MACDRVSTGGLLRSCRYIALTCAKLQELVSQTPVLGMLILEEITEVAELSIIHLEM